jgi:cell division protein FtsZ
MNMSPEPPLPLPQAAVTNLADPATCPEPQQKAAGSVSPVRIFAVGNAGVNVLEFLINSGLPANACVALNTDSASLARSSAGEKVVLEAKANPDLGVVGDPERGASAVEAQSERITALCAGARTVIIVAGMGGGIGTGAAPVVAQFARAKGAMVMAFGIMPFDCEGNLRQKLAVSGLQDLKEAAHLAVAFSNQRTMALATEATTLLETFKTANQLVSMSIRAAYHAFSGGAVMGLPFADICALIRDRACDCTLVAAEAEGQDRVAETADRLLNHPAIEGSAIIADADAVAVYVLGGPTMAMLEVNRLVERIGRECGAVPLIMGAAIEPALDGKLMLAVLAGRAEQQRPETRREDAQRCSRSENAIGDLNDGPCRRPPSRILPPPPEMSPERAMEIRDTQAGRKPRKTSPRMRQAQLPLDIVSKGRFDKAEPTIHKGEDLDVPTYVRRGIALN